MGELPGIPKFEAMRKHRFSLQILAQIACEMLGVTSGVRAPTHSGVAAMAIYLRGKRLFNVVVRSAVPPCLMQQDSTVYYG